MVFGKCSLFGGLITAMLVIFSQGPALAQDRLPDARLKFSSTSYGFLLGGSQGQGILEFQGQRYPFTVSGRRVGTIGMTQVDALGQVYGLRQLADFPGRYRVAEGGLTVGQGGGHTWLRNDRGVTLYVQNLQTGLEMTLGGGTVDVALREPLPPSSVDTSTTDARANPARPATEGLPPLELISPPRQR